MPKLDITFPHNLDQNEATKRLQVKEAEIKEKHIYTVTDLQETWTTPNTMEFSFKIYGFSLNGSVQSLDKAVNISLDLPFAAMLLRGTIESEIKKELAQILNC
ncbi:MAG: polyhydroxyalkanoic acid system family protein [Planctomycetaceae bacterium]|jgi:hypothetical protein|nr:polyhydroxyalkanoic acid system family protein [Planctomycetaceae bacterium]